MLIWFWWALFKELFDVLVVARGGIERVNFSLFGSKCWAPVKVDLLWVSRACSWTKTGAEGGLALVVTVRVVSRSRLIENDPLNGGRSALTSSRILRPSTCHEIFIELHIHLSVTFFDRMLQSHFYVLHVDLVLKLKRSVTSGALNLLKLGSFAVSIRSLSRSCHSRILVSECRHSIRSEAHTTTWLCLEIPKGRYNAWALRLLTLRLWTPKLPRISWRCWTFLQFFFWSHHGLLSNEPTRV